MAFEKYNIKQFKSAWFEQDYSELSKEEFDICYTEYVDTAGLFNTENFEKITYINYLANRINSVNLAIKTHKDFIRDFGVHYESGLKFFEKFGHYIKFNTLEQFLKDLDKIELKERKYISELENASVDLGKLKTKKDNKVSTVKESRASFIRMLSSLRKIGWVIDDYVTTIEELAIIVKSQSEQR